MGQIYITRWKAARLDDARQPAGTHFALNKDRDAIANALGAARAREATASIAAQLVMDQAVTALRDEGLTTRQIADVLHTSKSDVGRRLRDRSPAVLDYPTDILERITAITTRAWEHGV